MNIRVIYIIICFLVLQACKTAQNAGTPGYEALITEAMNESSLAKRPVYNPSEKRVNDLLHTKLDVRFDWKNQYLNGIATLTFTPYFYPVSSLQLDAKGFELAKVALLENGSSVDLDYQYNSAVIHINLGREYTRNDTFHIYIEYTAMPNELPEGGSLAITSDKGLYFINPLGEEKDKPQQIWTQGETEASSCWFPTIDSPNEKMTQEICITVDKRFRTISNGLLLFQTENTDGTRTDCWKQNLPHAPYLAMMAVGEYAEVKDRWKDIEVNYYVEPEYEKYAKDIFGNTTEMLEFYSEILGVDYPWEKFSQVIVRDFVSGAMENTTVVVFGEFVQKTHRELIDGDNEGIVAHELFHHWFGDLVTCESWANLPLNESFATYGEYLWWEHKYGRDVADHHLRSDLVQYLMASKRGQKNMIRYGYDNKDDMFDSHSYAKGGRILHMLRKQVGDDAFFQSLHLYLTKHAYKATEIHDLRLAFEEVSGEDLNWFFDQWFLASGHPELVIGYSYDDALKQQKVIIEQVQDFEKTPLYRLPIVIDIYMKGSVARHSVVIDEVKEEFVFDVASKPEVVNVDAEKMLLCSKKDQKDRTEWARQYVLAPLFLDRYEAIKECGNYARKDSASAKAVLDALGDPSHHIRLLAIRNLKYIASKHHTEVKEKLSALAKTDKKPSVRSAAIRALVKYFEDDKTLIAVYKHAASDSSYKVLGEALEAIADIDIEEGMKMAKALEQEKSSRILNTIARLYAVHGTEAESPFFASASENIKGFWKIGFMTSYAKFLENEKSEATVNSGISYFKDIAKGGSAFYVKMYAVQALKSIREMYGKKEHELNDLILKKEQEGSATAELDQWERALIKVKQQKDKLSTLLDELEEEEPDEQMINIHPED